MVSNLKNLETERLKKLAETKKNDPLNKSCSSNLLLDNKDRSHDGVFLRPVAVSSSHSPPLNARLSKRTSVDSGIGLEVGRQQPNIVRTNKYFKDFQKR